MGVEKQEIDESVFNCADVIATDSLIQSSNYGDLQIATAIYRRLLNT